MSHRLALTLSLFLTIAFAGLVVLERGVLFSAPIASDPTTVGSVPSADPALSDASLPANGLMVAAGLPSGIAGAGGTTRDDEPLDFGPAPVVAAPAGDAATTSQLPRPDRRHDRRDDHAAAQGGGDDE